MTAVILASSTGRGIDPLADLRAMGMMDKPFDQHSTLITPELAAALLERNVAKNRAVREQYVDKLVKDMKEGRFQKTGGTLSIDVNGEVIDGQHRLTASVVSGVSFRAIIVSGLPPEAYLDTDRGSKRTLGDSLRYQGFSNVTQMAALLRVLIKWDRGIRGSTVFTGDLSDSELLAYFPKVQAECVAATTGISPLPGVVSPRVIQLVRLLIVRALREAGDPVGENDSDDTVFLNALSSGISDSTTLIALREALLRDARDRSSRGSYWQLGVLLRTWNRWREGETMLTKAVPFVPGGAKANRLPLSLI